MNDVMTLEETAKFLRVCRQTLRNYAVSGKIPCRKVGRRYLFSRLAVLDWLSKIETGPQRKSGCSHEEN